MAKLPKDLGFKLGLKIRIGEPARIIEETPEASTAYEWGVVYVVLRTADSRPLKIGQAKGTLLSRWAPIAGIFGQRKLRNNEKEDRKKWLEVANGKEVSVWVRAAGKMRIPYGEGLTRRPFFSTRGAEEEFLDHYYRPILGKSLNRDVSEGTD